MTPWALSFKESNVWILTNAINLLQQSTDLYKRFIAAHFKTRYHTKMFFYPIKFNQSGKGCYYCLVVTQIKNHTTPLNLLSYIICANIWTCCIYKLTLMLHCYIRSLFIHYTNYLQDSIGSPFWFHAAYPPATSVTPVKPCRNARKFVRLYIFEVQHLVSTLWVDLFDVFEFK